MTPTTIKTIRGAIEAEISVSAVAMDEAKRQVEHAEHRARMATSDASRFHADLRTKDERKQLGTAIVRLNRAEIALAEFNAAYPEAK